MSASENSVHSGQQEKVTDFDSSKEGVLEVHHDKEVQTMGCMEKARAGSRTERTLVTKDTEGHGEPTMGTRKAGGLATPVPESAKPSTLTEGQSSQALVTGKSDRKLIAGPARKEPANGFGDGLILSLQPRDEVWAVDRSLRLPRNSPCCRYPIVVKDVVLEACIDSGATVCLISRKAYGRIKQYVGPVMPSNRRASGANGDSLQIDGWIRMSFRIGSALYTYGFLVSNLSGVDCLLGLDWLQSVGAIIDFATMQAELGPKETVQLRDEPLAINFCKVPIGQTLKAKGHTRVRCKATTWSGMKGDTAVFEPTGIKIQEGVDVGSSVVQVEPTGHFYIAVCNETENDVELPDDILIGRLDEIMQCNFVGETDTQPLRRTPGHCLWQMVDQRLLPFTTAEEMLVQPEYVATPLLRESGRSELSGVEPNPAKHPVRIVAAEEESDCSATPVGVRVYGIDGVELTGEDLTGAEFFDFLPGDEEGVHQSLSVDSNRVSGQSPEQKRNLENTDTVKGYHRRTNVHCLPEHLRCVLPPPGTLSDFQLRQLVELVMEFQDVFVGPDGKVGYNTLVRHKIDTGDATPYKGHPRKKSFVEKDHIGKEVRKLLEEGYIRPSMSPWGAPVVLAKKKDGTMRFCIDFRKLNDVTKKDAYPLPRIEECLDALNGSQYFSTMDLASGYWQVAMDPVDREKTAFTTHVGLYEWNVMPFGLCNAPATFSRMMEMILSDVVWKQCLVYLDDVIAFGTSFESALESLRAVMVRLRTHNLKLKAKKCEFFRTEVEYLGHEVGQQGTKPSLSKIQGLHDWKVPEDVTDIKSFLGFTGFYRRYIKNFAELAKPLTEKTKGGKEKPWTPLNEEEIAAFEAIIKALEERVLLHYVVPDKPFYLTTDASDYAIGGVLEQIINGVRVPLAFGSKTLEGSRTRYCATKKELYAIVFFMRYFLGFYRGKMLYIETDHYALEWLRNFKASDSMYHRWITEMDQYHPWEIKHIAGAKNVVADALSRRKGSKKPYKDCRFPDCEICKWHFRKNKRCRDPESQGESSDDDDDSDRPDRTDFVLWDLILYRHNDNDRMMQVLAVTREQNRKMVENSRTDYQPPRRSQRIAAQRAEKRAAVKPRTEAKSKPKRTVQQAHRDRVRRTEHKRKIRSEKSRRKRLIKISEPDSGYSSGGSEGPPEDELSRSDVSTRLEDPVAQPTAETQTQVGPTLPESSSSPTETGVNADEEDPGEAVLRGLEAVLECYSDEDWVREQNNDLVIKRLKELLQIFEEQPKGENIKGESPAVQSLVRDWYSYVYDKGVLCRRVYRLSTSLDEGTLQRLVPLKWQMMLWKFIHQIEVRHLSYEKVIEMMARRWTWYHMSQDLLDWGKACLTCQKSKAGIGRGLEELKQDYVCRRNQRVAMDLVGILPETEEGNLYILVIQDYYTKWVELVPIRNKKATTVAFAFLRFWIAHWGCPEILHSDQGNEFDAAVFREVCRLWGIRKTRTTPFNPSSNGMVERSNRTMKSLLKNMGDDMYMTTWDIKLPEAMIAMNNAVHKSTGFSPFRLQVAGNEDMRVPADLIFGTPSTANTHCEFDFVFKQRIAMQEIAELVRRNLNKAMAIQRKARAQGPLKIRDYKVGDLVLRWYPPNAAEKLRPDPFTGPYEVVEVDRDGRKVKLKDLKTKGRGVEDKWVHVSALKPVLRTKEGLILMLNEENVLVKTAGIMDPGPKYTDRPLPPVASFDKIRSL